jgi:hypothetical protein
MHDVTDWEEESTPNPIGVASPSSDSSVSIDSSLPMGSIGGTMPSKRKRGGGARSEWERRRVIVRGRRRKK